MYDGLPVVKLLRAVIEALENLGVRHALIGAGAMATCGVSRSTGDIDLLTTDSVVFEESSWNGLRGSGASIDIRRGDYDDPLAGVIRISSERELPVDLVVGKFQWQQEIVERASRLVVGPADDSVELAVARASDLILLKLYAGGLQDLWDIRQLLANDPSLEAEVQTLVGQLPEESLRLWRGVLAEASGKA